MVQIRRPIDTPDAALSNEVRVTTARPDPRPQATQHAAQIITAIADRARDQQIDNDVRTSTIRLRTRLDALRTQVEQDPDYATMPQRWAEQSRDISDEVSGALTSPAHQRAWRERSEVMLADEGRYINERTQMRGVEVARAGLIGTLGELQRTMTDPDAVEETRGAALGEIEGAIANAVLRRTINADDGARMLESARNERAEFQRTEGRRARAVAEVDRIWTAADGDYAAAQEFAREIEDPALRDDVEDRLATRYARDEAGAQESLEDAMERAYSMIEEAGSLDRLTVGDRRLIERAGNMDTLRTYMRARLSPDANSQASENLRYQLMSLNGVTDGVSTARIFAQMPLTTALTEDQAELLQRYGVNVQPGLSLRAQLAPDDFEAVRAAHSYARGDEGSGAEGTTLQTRTFNLLWGAAQDGSGGILPDDINGRTGSNGGVENQRRFQAFLSREAEVFVRERNREPNAAEIRQILRTALMNTRSSPVVMGMRVGGTNRPLYQAADAGRIPRVPYQNIPVWHRDRLRRELVASGVAASTDEQRRAAIEDAYMNWLAQGASQ